MTKIKSLVYDTAIYGISSIVGRFLNYLLVPLYTNTLTPADYGISTNVFGWIALVLMLLTFGMETGFFRFASDKDKEADVFGTTLSFITFNSLLFIASIFLFKDSIGSFLGYENSYELIIYAAIIVSLDAITAIPFAKLRLDKRPLVFAGIRMINIFINIGFNLLFFIVLPYLEKTQNLHVFFFKSEYLLQYIFISNLVASGVTLVLLTFFGGTFHFKFNKKIFFNLLNYSTPIVIVSLAGVINMYGDKILYPFLINDTAEANRQLGIYGANYKIGALMVLFTQAFRYAFEPFIFSNRNNLDSRVKFGEIMTHFVWFGMLIMLFVLLFLPYIQFMIGVDYREGLVIVPLILFANLFSGIFFNLSVWYKLTDKTRFGSYFALGGSVVIIGLNVIFVPKFGYIASAWAALLSNIVMVVASYIFMRKHYPLKYNYLRICEYILVALALWIVNLACSNINVYLVNAVRVTSLLLYFVYYIKRQNLTYILKRS